MRSALRVGLLALVAMNSAQAGTLIGGSDLLSAADISQLETWVGKGALTLTNIFDKVPGNTSEDFHAAADLKGPTISVLEITALNDRPLASPVRIGGYNPQSWDANLADFIYTFDLAGRTAFLFNLTNGQLARQNLDATGAGQTYNGLAAGPSFGGGYDLLVEAELNYGTANNFGFGSERIFGIAGQAANYTIGQLEVFSVTTTPVPLPAAAWLLAPALVGLGARRRRAA